MGCSGHGNEEPGGFADPVAVEAEFIPINTPSFENAHFCLLVWETETLHVSKYRSTSPRSYRTSLPTLRNGRCFFWERHWARVSIDSPVSSATSSAVSS